MVFNPNPLLPILFPTSNIIDSIEPPPALMPISSCAPSNMSKAPICVKIKRDNHMELKVKARKWDNIVALTKRKRRFFTNASVYLMASAAMTLAPIISFAAATRLIYLIYCSIFKEIEVPIIPEEVVNVAPTRDSIRSILIDTAAGCLAAVRIRTKGKLLPLSMDAANKSGTRHMVKVIACWDIDNDRMLIFALDADACDGTNVRAAQTADHVMIKLEHDNLKAKLQNSITNSGC